MNSNGYRFRQISTRPYLLSIAMPEVPEVRVMEDLQVVGSKKRLGRRLIRIMFVCLGLPGLLLLGFGWFEARTSYFQARYLSGYAASIDSVVQVGASAAFGAADGGPLDQRMGYVRLPEMIGRLEQRGFDVEEQARWSALMMQAQQQGLFVIYPRKVRAGLSLFGADGALIYEYKYPQQHYEQFEDIPDLLVQTLLFIEDREVLNELQLQQNPAVAPTRLMRAVLDKCLSMLGSRRDVAGGSTLATQMEKFNHSASGRTDSVHEKVRQMMSASLRAYLGGPQTLESRRAIVRDYVNSVPLGARGGWGEVHGVGDGLSVWFGQDFVELNRLLNADPPAQDNAFREYARAYRAVLMMLLAQQRPAAFLPSNIDRLNARADLFLKMLHEQGLVSRRLYDAALVERIAIAEEIPREHVRGRFAETPKALKTWQLYLGNLLGVQSLYALDRMDVSAQATLDLKAQRAVEEILMKLRNPEEVRRRGLDDRTLVGYGRADEIVYSVFLVERGSDNVDRVRVQTDTLGDALDMNHGSKLDLGSTSKLRVLVHYLEVVEALHEEFSSKNVAEQSAYQVRRNDDLTKWAVSYLRRNQNVSVATMLRAAMRRGYSADPDASFMTGGGEHRFGNVVEDDEDEDALFLSVQDAFRVSSNLVFVRIMQDIVNYHIARLPDDRADVLEVLDDPRRDVYLERFAAQEARKHVSRFYDRYHGRDADEVWQTLYRGVRWSKAERAVVKAFIEGSDEVGSGLYERAGRDSPNPVELFVVRHLLTQPEATLGDVMVASEAVRERSKSWFLWPGTEVERQRWIRYGLEEDAFEEIGKAWRAVGFPFERMVPSYASALGASADRPSALAELVGIIQAGGVRRPIVRIEDVRFGEGTPYETHMGLRPVDEVKRVMSAEVAAVLREALAEVAARGTGRHGRWSFQDGEGNRLQVGGKTGTGDNRHNLYNRNGRVVGYRTTNRTATWTFMIGDCLYGTIVAYVPGEGARRHTFMSELSVRVLDELKPALEGLVEGCSGD